MSDSLTRRLVMAVLAAEILASSAFAGVALWHERHSRLHAFDTILKGNADSLSGAIQDAEDSEDNVFVDPAEFHLPFGDSFAVYGQDGRQVGNSPVHPAVLLRAQSEGYRVMLFNKERYRVLQRQALRIIDRGETQGAGLRKVVTIVYASPLRSLDKELRQAAWFYVAGGVLLAAATAGTLLLLLRRSLYPLYELTLAAQTVSPYSRAFTAPPSAEQLRELRPLAHALTELVERLAKAIETEHRFVSNATHELKTAVAVVRSTVQVLALRKRSAMEYQQGLERVLVDNERVERIVVRMLQLGRSEERGEKEIKTIDLAQAARRVVSERASTLVLKRLHLVYDLESDLQVRISSEDFDIVMANLLDNAVRHSSINGSIMLRGAAVGTTAHTAVLEMQDFGEGISSQSLPHVFERFYREDRSRSRETGGSGLGLAICKGLINAAGGTISIQSKKQEGTTVRIELPLAACVLREAGRQPL